SHQSACDLQQVIADLNFLEMITSEEPLPDDRNWFEKVLDTLTRTKFLGTYFLKSIVPVPDLRLIHVEARVVLIAGQQQVTLSEYIRSGSIIQTQIEHRSLATLRLVLENYCRDHGSARD